jgi:hypothetical protein
MVFIYLLCVVHTAVETGSVVLRKSHEALQEQEDVADCAEYGVGGFKVRTGVGKLGIEDDGEAGIEGDGREGIYCEVDSSS